MDTFFIYTFLRMKIVLVNNESQDFSARDVPWEGHTIRFSSVGFGDIASGLGSTDPDIRINRESLDLLVSETLDADAIYCESPEALLLWYVFRKRSGGGPPFVMEDEDVLWRVTSLAAWIAKVYREDVLADFLADPANVWLHHNSAHRGRFLDAGLDPDRLFHLPCSSYLISLVSPQSYARLRNFSPIATDPDVLAMKDSVLCPGANRRDYAAFAAATRGLPANAWILGHRGTPLPDSGHVRWKGFVPLDDFLDALALAGIVVVPMLDEALGGGENTLSFSMALGKPVVATDTAATRELILSGEDGLLVPAGDAAALRAAVMFLADAPEQAALMGENARERERGIASLTRKTLLRAFRLAAKAPK